MEQKEKIVFMGTPSYATVIFQRLLEKNYNIVALFTQPDKPVGRKQLLTPPDIKKFCLENGLSLPIYQPKSLKEKSVTQNIKAMQPDKIIVAAYGQLLPQEVLDIAPCINLHASLLPQYRGASPIQQSLLNGDHYTGVTAMNMELGLDSGDILGYKYLCIEPTADIEKLFDDLSVIAADLTIDILENYNTIEPKKQNNSMATYCKKITKKDGLIFFENAQEIYNRFKAFKNWPGIHLENGLKIKSCELVQRDSINQPGVILSIEKSSILIGSKKGQIKIFQVQPPSKKEMNSVDYIRGVRLKVGDTLS